MDNEFLNWKDIFPELENEQMLMEFFSLYYNCSINSENEIIHREYVFNVDIGERVKAVVNEDCPFNGIIVYQLARCFRQFCEVINRYDDIVTQESCMDSVLGYMSEKILKLMIKTLIYDIQECDANNLLMGNTSDERYIYYNEKYSVDLNHIEELEERYPTLFWLIDVTIENQISYLEEILEHVKENYAEIQKLVGLKEIGRIHKLHFGLGDAHNQGRTVVQIDFENGNIIYKPRSLDLEKNWALLVEFINGKLDKRLLRAVKVISYSDYGFMEKASAKTCDSAVKEEYFFRLGCLLAALYSLNASDCHYENVLMDNAFPVIVDAEMLLSINPKERGDASGSIVKAIKSLYYSVNQVGILPQKIAVGRDKIDIGITVLDEKENRVRVPVLKDKATTNIHFEYEYQSIQDNNKIHLEKCNVQKSIKAIVDGFEKIYRFILENKEEYTIKVLKLFKKNKMRVLYNPTTIYGDLLAISYHPFFMKRKENRIKLLSRIALTNREEVKVVQSEIEMMLYNDVPYFEMGFSEKSIINAKKNMVVKNSVFSPKNIFLRKMGSLSDEDLSLQKEIIKDSYYSFDYTDNFTDYKWDINVTANQLCNYLKEATGMLDYLYRTRSFTDVNTNNLVERCFVGSTILNMDKDEWKKDLVDFDFYDGHIGLVYLYLYAAKYLGDSRYKVVGNEIFNMIYSNFHMLLGNQTVLTGVHKGLGGYIITLCDFKDELEISVNEFLIQLLKIGYGAMESNNNFDYIGGNVGFVLAALRTDEQINESDVLKLVKMIVSKFKKILIDSKKETYTRFSGYAHGMSSLMVLLYKLYVYSNDIYFFVLFKELLEYDRKHFFDRRSLDWIRSLDDKEFSKGWCHGSPGILLGRIQLKEMGYSDASIDHEIQILKKNVIEKCFGNNMSYCHGDIGNLTILKKVAICERDDITKKIIDLNFKSLAEKAICEWEKLDKPVYKLDGIMAGLGGIAFSIINFVRDDKIPPFISLV